MKNFFVLDNNILKAIINNDDSKKTLQAFDRMKKMKKEFPEKTIVATTMASLLRAIHLADEESTIERVQEILENVSVIPTNANFKNEKDVMEDLIEFARSFGSLGVGK